MDSVKEWQQKTEEKFLQEEELKEEKNSQSATNIHEDNNSFFTNNKLGKEEIIRGHESFSKIFESSNKFSCGLLRAFVSEKQKNFNSPPVYIKAGFVVTKKKIKKAVPRMRIKRLLREAYRLEKTSIKISAVTSSREIIFSLSDRGYDKFINGALDITALRNDMRDLLNKIFKRST